jgi:hypothetical protein
MSVAPVSLTGDLPSPAGRGIEGEGVSDFRFCETASYSSFRHTTRLT